MLSDDELTSRLKEFTQRQDSAGILRLGDELDRSGEVPSRFSVAIGQALAASGKPRDGLKWLDRVSPSDKQYEFARGNIARILGGLGEHEQVLKVTDGRDAVSLSEAMAAARARSLTSLSRTGETVDLVRQIEETRGAPAHLLEIGADASIALQDWASALDFIEKAIGKSSEPRFRFRRGVFLFHLDRLDESLEALQPFTDIPEFAIRANTHKFRIYQKQNNSAEMLRICSDIVSIDPGNEFALDNLIKFNLEILNFSQAEFWFNHAQDHLPGKFPPALFNFLKYEREGKYRLALTPFEGGHLDDTLTDGSKERIANAYYYMGKNGKARRVARKIEDPERKALLKAKISLAENRPERLGNLPDSNEGRIIEALDLYKKQRFKAALQKLEETSYPERARLPIKNFQDLCKAKRLLPGDLFSESILETTDDAEMPVIQQLWVGSELSYIEFLSIRSFLACGHTVHLYTYDGAIKVPSGCVVKDAREIMPESEIFAHSHKTGRSTGSFAGFADLFRWKLVYEKGGAWADADVICLEPIRSTEMVNTELVRLGTVMLPGVTNCFFAAKKGEKAFLTAYKQSHAKDRTELLWGEIGIHLMAEIVAKKGWGNRLTYPSDICPIPPFRIIEAVLGSIEIEPLVKQTRCRAIHLYNEVMRTVGMDKNGHFPKKGLIGYLEEHVSRLEANATLLA